MAHKRRDWQNFKSADM